MRVVLLVLGISTVQLHSMRVETASTTCVDDQSVVIMSYLDGPLHAIKASKTDVSIEATPSSKKNIFVWQFTPRSHWRLNKINGGKNDGLFEIININKNAYLTDRDHTDEVGQFVPTLKSKRASSAFWRIEKADTDTPYNKVFITNEKTGRSLQHGKNGLQLNGKCVNKNWGNCKWTIRETEVVITSCLADDVVEKNKERAQACCPLGDWAGGQSEVATCNGGRATVNNHWAVHPIDADGNGKVDDSEFSLGPGDTAPVHIINTETGSYLLNLGKTEKDGQFANGDWNVCKWIPTSADIDVPDDTAVWYLNTVTDQVDDHTYYIRSKVTGKLLKDNINRQVTVGSGCQDSSNAIDEGDDRKEGDESTDWTLTHPDACPFTG